ncbi:MAG TPA: 2,3-diaminopropionate biosynthesis protein SbnA [Pyrinomonadaceae bacterium]|jgi:cysteine synthase A|nr:2,3-diaminopropionate biosynthesis protein SbnA [Pyrinomonadaceae bacterium]
MPYGILSTIGNTPLVLLRRIFKNLHFDLRAKLEAFNPGGSVKDRPAFNILQKAMEQGVVRRGSTVVESSSGNMGIGLAQACAYFGMRFVCVIDPKTTAQNINILKAYGAEIDLVSRPDAATGEFLQARIQRVRDLLAELPGSFWPDQYSNMQNAMAHRQTMHEIWSALEGRVDYLFCAASTCGTLHGCSAYVRENGLKTHIVAVDAIGSILFGPKSCKRLIPGHGAAVLPKLYRPDLADRSTQVSDLDCVVGCRRLVREEAILAGGSSGAVVWAVGSAREWIPEGATVVAIFPDRGERYLDTIYSDEWVREHFGEISHLWDGTLGEEETCEMATY